MVVSVFIIIQILRSYETQGASETFSPSEDKIKLKKVEKYQTEEA